MHAAGLDMSFETWESAALPGFRLGLPEDEYDDQRTLTLAARERNINDFAERVYGEDFFYRTTHKLHDVIRDLLITWSLHGLAQQYHAQLSEHRDSWKRSDGAGVEGAIDRAKEAKTVMGEVADARVIARDLARVTETDHWLQREPLTFRQVVPALRKHHSAELHAALTDLLRREAHALDVLSSDLEASTVAGSNLDVARSNLLLQRKVVSLTRWLVGFTIGLFLLTVILGVLTYLALTKQG